MPKLLKLFDPEERRRRVHFFLRAEQDPLVLRFLPSIPHGLESAWWRGLAKTWIAKYGNAPDLDRRMAEVLHAGTTDRLIAEQARERTPTG